MDYSYEFAAEEGIFGALIFSILYMLAAFAVGITFYVLRSLGVYTIAKRRGIRHAWFSWFPVVDYYLLGCISDQYQYVVKGNVKNKRRVLLGLGIAMAVLTLGFFGGYIAVVVQGVQAAFNGVSEDVMMQRMMGPMSVIMGLSIPMMILSIVTLVFRYMALYDLYTSCAPSNNVLFLVLSIIFNVTEPFFIFFNRKKDDGMPPRKQEPRSDVPFQTLEEAPAVTPETDPWDRPDNQ